jgi:ABC-2 type transport system permease protein
MTGTPVATQRTGSSAQRVARRGHVRLFRTELAKQCRRARGWIVLAVMAVVPALLTGVIGATRPQVPERIGSEVSVVTATSGFTVPLIALNAMLLFFLPLGVALVAGEAVAGEAGWGTLRYVLASGASRSRLLGAKAAVAGLFSLASVVVVALSSVLCGVLAFGWRPLPVVDLARSGILGFAGTTYAPLEALARVAAACGVVALSLLSTYAFALWCSTLTSWSFGAVGAGLGLLLVSRAIQNVPGLAAVGPWLPSYATENANLWTGVLVSPARLGFLLHLALVQGVYAVVFLAAAWVGFVRRDYLW